MAKDLNVFIKLKLLADGVSSGFKTIGDSIDGIGSRLKLVAAAVASYFGFQAFAGAIKGAADLEAKLSEVKSVSGATADEMVALRKAAEDAGASTKYTSTEAADALGNLARAGLSAQEAIAALPATLQLAQAGGIGLGQASEFITKTVMGMGLAFTDAGRVADVLAKGANASNTSVTGLAEAMSYTAPIAKSLGLDLETTVAIIGKFADGGIDASRAGTALNAILAQFADPASKFRQELGQIGIVTNNFSDALVQLADKGAKGNNAILAVGTEAGPALRSLLNQGIGALTELTGKLRDAKGSAAETAAVMGDNLNGAVDNLSSAWDALKIALGTPVLPVLKQGVTDLATALQDAVNSGTVKRFGESIATSFQAGITWVKAFVAQVDFTALATRLDEFAAKAGQTFDRIGEAATNAGNIVKLFYGVMSAGVNSVLSVIYLLGEGWAKQQQFILTGISYVLQGLSKITFGEVSKRFAAAADDMREKAGAFGAVSDALADKAKQAFNSAGDAAVIAQEGWHGLTESQTEASKATQVNSGSVTDLAAKLNGLTESQKAAALETVAGSQKQAEALQQAKTAAEDLKKAYDAAVAGGDWQGAAEKAQLLGTAMADVANKTKAAGQQATGALTDIQKKAAEAAKEVQDAFVRMGIQSSATLSDIATRAEGDFKIIRDAGTSTPQDIQAAFEKYAEAVIASGDKVKIATLSAQASFHNLEVATDASGKAFLRSTVSAGGYSSSLNDVRGSAIDTRTALERMNDELERQIAAEEKSNELKQRAIDLQNKRNNVDSNGFSLDMTGKTTVNAAGNTLQSVISTLEGFGLDQATAQAIARQFTDANGNVPYSNNPGQAKYGGSTLSDALLNAAQKAKDIAQQPAPKGAGHGMTTNTGGIAQQPKPIVKPSSATSSSTATASASTSHTVTINLAGRTTTINTSSATDANSLAEVLQQLKQEAARAA